jgi:hypothetical protein
VNGKFSMEQELTYMLQDYACIDQSNPTPGVSALPIIIAQCDAVISLVDEKYYDRAWCCVEARIIQVLKRSYNQHCWYEYVEAPVSSGGEAVGVLREGPMDMTMIMAEKELTFEEDRHKVLFLERQIELLGYISDAREYKKRRKGLR